MKIIHIIPSLNSGGAETMLYKLLRNKTDSMYDIEIVTLFSGGFYAEKIKEMKIPVHELRIGKKRTLIKTFLELIKILKKADIIQSWMYHSDLVSFIVGKLILRKKVIWGVRRSYLDKKHMKSGTYFIAKVCALFSRYVDGIISCTIIGKRNHEKFGYSNSQFLVIQNGFELNEFKFSKGKFKKPLKLLNVARWEPLKDHSTLLKAISILMKKGIEFELYLVGSEINNDNKDLMKMIRENKLENKVKLLGVREDIPKIMSLSDIYISSSISEGFPNVIGEAMASGLYCVATDAGDTEYIIDKYGTIVPIENERKLAEGILRALDQNDSEIIHTKYQARKRIEEKFSIQSVVKQYEMVYEKNRK